MGKWLSYDVESNEDDFNRRFRLFKKDKISICKNPARGPVFLQLA